MGRRKDAATWVSKLGIFRILPSQVVRTIEQSLHDHRSVYTVSAAAAVANKNLLCQRREAAATYTVAWSTQPHTVLHCATSNAYTNTPFKSTTTLASHLDMATTIPISLTQPPSPTIPHHRPPSRSENLLLDSHKLDEQERLRIHRRRPPVSPHFREEEKTTTPVERTSAAQR